jgi:hypothetical protein
MGGDILCCKDNNLCHTAIMDETHCRLEITSENELCGRWIHRSLKDEVGFVLMVFDV